MAVGFNGLQEILCSWRAYVAALRLLHALLLVITIGIINRKIEQSVVLLAATADPLHLAPFEF